MHLHNAKLTKILIDLFLGFFKSIFFKFLILFNQLYFLLPETLIEIPRISLSLCRIFECLQNFQ